MIKDGKLFGKINLFDAAILLLIIALIIAGVSKFRTFNGSVDSSMPGKIIYTFNIDNIRDYTLQAFKSGDTVFDSSTNIAIGTIKNIEYKNSMIAKSMVDGTVKVVENPYKKDVILTIETPGTVTDLGYFANKSIELKVGSEKNIETLYATTIGKIGSIAYSEGE